MAKMHHISLTRHTPYTPQQLFDLVCDVDSYQQFVPYCCASRVVSRQPTPTGALMCAELAVAYRFLRETYSSQIILSDSPLAVRIEQVRGPFRHLQNCWQFEAAPPSKAGKNGCIVHFDLHFDFAVPLLRHVVQPIMPRVTEKFISIFEARAATIYGAKISQSGG